MTLNNGWRKAKNISVIIAIIGGIGALGGWYKTYADSTAVTAETLKTHTKEIANLEENYKGMHDMMRTMFVIDSIKNADDTELMSRVYAITNNKDTVPETLGTNEWSTDNLGKDNLE